MAKTRSSTRVRPKPPRQAVNGPTQRDVEGILSFAKRFTMWLALKSLKQARFPSRMLKNGISVRQLFSFDDFRFPFRPAVRPVVDPRACISLYGHTSALSYAN